MVEQTPESRPRAPGQLGLVQEFINSGHIGAVGKRINPVVAEEIRERFAAGANRATLAKEYGLSMGFLSAIVRRAPLDDELPSVRAAAGWLAAHGLVDPGTSVSDDELERMLKLRAALRAMAVSNAGHDLDPAVLVSLNRIAASIPVVLHFEREPTLRQTARGVDAAIGRMLAVVAEAMLDGTWQRLKRCPGTGCPATFYDASKNRSGTWCSMSVCGNRAKVRNYQSRQRLPSAPIPPLPHMTAEEPTFA